MLSSVYNILIVLSPFSYPGVWILSERLVLTASLDQRVSLWHLTEEENILKVNKKLFLLCIVPDNVTKWKYHPLATSLPFSIGQG